MRLESLGLQVTSGLAEQSLRSILEMNETTWTVTENTDCRLWPVKNHMVWLAMLYKVHFDEVHGCEQKQKEERKKISEVLVQKHSKERGIGKQNPTILN